MKYYYLAGIEKKGPYTVEEIRLRKLGSDTLIYRDDKNNWFPLSNFPELNLKKDSEDDNSMNTIAKQSIDQGHELPSIETKKIKLPKYTFLILLIITSIGSAALITYFQQKSDYNKLNNQINVIFKGNTTISDYAIDDRLDGKLYDVVYHAGEKNDPFFRGDNYVSVNDIRIATQPYSPEKEKDDYWYRKGIKQWELFKNLNQYFIKDQYVDGFLVMKLSRSSDVFTIETNFGGDMAYKVPEKVHKNGINYGYFSTPGYDISTFRPSVKKCYRKAAEYLTKEDEDSSYVPDSFSKIFDIQLGAYKSDFYEIVQWGDKYYRLGDTIRVITFDGNSSYVIDREKVTSSTSRDDAYVYTSDWVVWYKSYYNKYILQPQKWAFLKYISIYSTIGILLSIIGYFIMINRKRIVIE